MKRIALVLTLTLSACSTGKYASKSESNTASLTGSAAPMAHEELKNDLSRSFKPDDYSEVRATLVTEPLIRAKYAQHDPAGFLNPKDHERMMQKEITVRVKKRTCFDFTGIEKTSFLSGNPYNSAEWKGVVITDGGEKSHKLYFSKVSLDACTESPIDVASTFGLLVKTQLRGTFGPDVGYMTWERKGTPPITLKTESGPKGPGERMLDSYLAAHKKDSISYLTADRLKVMTTAIQTDKIKYFVEQLPLGGDYTWEDFRIFSAFATALAKDRGNKCPLPFINHFNSLGMAELALAYVERFDEYKMARGYRCAPVAEQLYSWNPPLRESIENEVNNAMAELSRFNFSGASEEEMKNFTASLQLFQKMHKQISRRCVNGEKDQCIRAEFFEENIKNFKLAQKQLEPKASSSRVLRQFLEELRKLEQQRKNREQQKKDFFVSR